DGEAVVRYLESSRQIRPLPALLILSLKMARMGGLQVLEHLVATCRNKFPTVLLIDASDHNVTLAVTAYRLGAESFLLRPIPKKEFCSLMSHFQAVTMDGCAEAHASTEPQTTVAPFTPDTTSTGIPGATAPPRPTIPAAVP